MFSSPGQAYDLGNKSSSSNRDLEAAALFKAARFLETCRQEWAAPDRDTRLDEALKFNSRLWTLFQAELMRPDHELPEGIRANLLQLSLFVDQRTFEIMAEPHPGRLQALIDINRNVASGLSASGN